MNSQRLLVAIIAMQFVAIAGLAFVSWQGRRDLTTAIQTTNATNIYVRELQSQVRDLRADVAETRCYVGWAADRESRIYPTHCERSALRSLQ